MPSIADNIDLTVAPSGNVEAHFSPESTDVSAAFSIRSDDLLPMGTEFQMSLIRDMTGSLRDVNVDKETGTTFIKYSLSELTDKSVEDTISFAVEATYPDGSVDVAEHTFPVTDILALNEPFRQTSPLLFGTDLVWVVGGILGVCILIVGVFFAFRTKKNPPQGEGEVFTANQDSDSFSDMSTSSEFPSSAASSVSEVSSVSLESSATSSDSSAADRFSSR